MLEAAVMCLALNIWHEARGETLEGQVAVAMVTMNRARATENVCREVYKPAQFSWTLDDEKREWRPGRQFRRSQQWQTIERVARLAIGGRLHDVTRGATHYHATYVRPHWSAAYTRVRQIGDHIFYIGKTYGTDAQRICRAGETADRSVC